MTITALSKALGVSTPTIYRRLKGQGVNLDELRDGKELTQHGVQVIASLFDRDDLVTQGVKCNVSGAEHETFHDTLQGETVLQVQVASLRAQVDGLQALVAQLEAQRDDLRRLLDVANAALEREQSDRAQERALLTTGTDDRRHWWQRLFNLNQN